MAQNQKTTYYLPPKQMKWYDGFIIVGLITLVFVFDAIIAINDYIEDTWEKWHDHDDYL